MHRTKSVVAHELPGGVTRQIRGLRMGFERAFRPKRHVTDTRTRCNKHTD